MARTAIIVQARLGSTRLPGKVLMEMGGQTVLAHVLERCRAVAGVDVVCCAIPEGTADDPVAAAAAACGVEVARGSESDVLDRYYRASIMMGATRIMRVTSDCPLIDPALCAGVLHLLDDPGADYACNNMPSSWPHGLDCEAFSFQWLERAALEARRPSEREHVTPFLRNHPDTRKANLAGPGASVTHLRWTLDTPEDLTLMQALFSRLPVGPQGWSWEVVRDLVEREPALALINAGYDNLAGLKKSLVEDLNQGFTL